MATTIGSQLRAARERKQQSVAAVATAIRSKSSIIEAIERDDFSVFSASIYGKGFIRLYAQYVGLDPQPLIDAYMESTAPRKKAVPFAAPPRAEPVPAATRGEEIRAPNSADMFNEVPERTRSLTPPEPAPLLTTVSDAPDVGPGTWRGARAPVAKRAPWRESIAAARDLAREVWVTWRLTLRERIVEMRAEKDPWKVVPLTIGLVVLLVFVASGLSRCNRKPPEDAVLKETAVQEPLKLAMEAPEPYFE